MGLSQKDKQERNDEKAGQEEGEPGWKPRCEVHLGRTVLESRIFGRESARALWSGM